ncbi:MAG: DNA-directed RNA polymerase subunit P [Methanobacteriota archaeon]|nr:MAG: DNA-directed RNA polymerase subunit P [Euryarchaeota archaeon]
MIYRCGGCKALVELDLEYGGVRCPKCGFRILYKVRPEIVKRIRVK